MTREQFKAMTPEQRAQYNAEIDQEWKAELDRRSRIKNCQTEVREPEVWYELEHSKVGANDWFASTDNADTLKSIRENLVRVRTQAIAGWEWRAIKKTLTVEVVE